MCEELYFYRIFPVNQIKSYIPSENDKSNLIFCISLSAESYIDDK